MSTPRLAATLSSPVAFAAAVLVAVLCVVAVAVAATGGVRHGVGARVPRAPTVGTTALQRPTLP